jgi:Anti-sigma-28 factor, FlgM
MPPLSLPVIARPSDGQRAYYREPARGGRSLGERSAWTFVGETLDGFRRAYTLPPVKTSTVFDEPAAKLSEIKEKIGRGEYQVDELAVADAILRRRRQRQPSAAWIPTTGCHSIDSATCG